MKYHEILKRHIFARHAECGMLCIEVLDRNDPECANESCQGCPVSYPVRRAAFEEDTPTCTALAWACRMNAVGRRLTDYEEEMCAFVQGIWMHLKGRRL